MGYITHEELVWLATEAGRHDRIVEIGTYFGKSTRAMADNTEGIIYTIDNFKGPTDASIPDFMRDNVFELCVWGLRNHIESGKVIIVVADHAEANVPITPDMVFIDGSHEYPDVKRDIEMWLPRMQKGGLLCGHDYTNIPGVKQAVDELLKPRVARGTSIWYMKLPK